jgi:hypothetical protein
MPIPRRQTLKMPAFRPFHAVGTLWKALDNLDRLVQSPANLIPKTIQSRAKPVQKANEFNYSRLTASLIWTAVILDFRFSILRMGGMGRRGG